MIILNDMLLDLVAEMIVFVDKNMYTKTLANEIMLARIKRNKKW